MHTYFFFALLLFCASMTEKLNARTKIKIDSPLLRAADGMKGFMDADAVRLSVEVWHLIHTIQYGTTPTKTDTNKGTKKEYLLSGKIVCLKDLVLLEHQYKKEEITQDSPLWQAFQDTLQKIKNDFITQTSPLLDQAELEKQTNIQLIKLWTDAQKKYDSLLLNWGKGDERAILMATSALDFFKFCNDLKHFLEDIMYSSPVSRNQFKEKYLAKETWTEFDRSFAD